jgi:hypothetical protein
MIKYSKFFDGFIGIYQHDLGKSIGPFVLALLQIIALTMVSKKEYDREKLIDPK